MTQADANARRYCGKDFNSQEIDAIRHIVKNGANLSRRQMSRLICQELNWLKPDGGLKEMSCRVALLRMHRDGLIVLPPTRYIWPGQSYRIEFTTRTDPQLPIHNSVQDFASLRVSPVKSKDESRLWNEYIHRYHYLGFKTLPGAQIRYFIYSENTLLAVIGYSAAAWKVAPRDRFIGWSEEQRRRNLHLVVNNARFLILPWVHSKNLASKILALMAKRLPQDWHEKYNYAPVLLESFVQENKFKGTCYKAANWVSVGTSQGRGKLDRHNLCLLPKKHIWLYPLCMDFKTQLCH